MTKATEYESIVKSLEGFWDSPWDDLSDQSKQLWRDAAYLNNTVSEHGPCQPVALYQWDSLSPVQRQSIAAQHDGNHDPAYEAARQIGFYEFDIPASLAAISALEAAHLLLIRESDLLVRFGIPCPETDAPPLARKLLSAEEMLTGKAVDELVKVTYQPLGEWLTRARSHNIEYLPGLDLAVKESSPCNQNVESPDERKLRMLAIKNAGTSYAEIARIEHIAESRVRALVAEAKKLKIKKSSESLSMLGQLATSNKSQARAQPKPKTRSK